MKNLEKQFKDYKNRVERGILEGHKKTIINMSEQSLKECPLDKGPLRESFKVDLNNEGFIQGDKSGIPKILKDIKKVNTVSISSTASYTAEYVLYQHEDITLKHPTPGTKAKFLEDPGKEATVEYRRNIIKNVKEALK